MSIEMPRQSFGKKLAKIFLPVLIGLNVPLLGIEIESMLNPIDMDKAGKWAMTGSQVFDYVIVPVTLLFLLMVQWLILVPVWNRVFLKMRKVLLSSLCIGIIISVFIAALLGYLALGDRFEVTDLINSMLVMSSITVTYCMLNIVTLYFLDKHYIKQLRAQKFQSI